MPESNNPSSASLEELTAELVAALATPDAPKPRPPVSPFDLPVPKDYSVLPEESSTPPTAGPDDYTYSPVSADDPLLAKYTSSIEQDVRKILDTEKAPWNTISLSHYGKGVASPDGLPPTIIVGTTDAANKAWPGVQAKIKDLCTKAGAAALQVAVVESAIKLIVGPHPPARGFGISMTEEHDYPAEEGDAEKGVYGTLGGFITLHFPDGTTKQCGLTNDHVVRWWQTTAGATDRTNLPGSTIVLSPSNYELRTERLNLIERLKPVLDKLDSDNRAKDPSKAVEAPYAQILLSAINTIQDAVGELMRGKEWDNLDCAHCELLCDVAFKILCYSTTLNNEDESCDLQTQVNRVKHIPGLSDETRKGTCPALIKLARVASNFWKLVNGNNAIADAKAQNTWNYLSCAVYFLQYKFRRIGRRYHVSGTRIRGDGDHAAKMDWGLIEMAQPQLRTRSPEQGGWGLPELPIFSGKLSEGLAKHANDISSKDLFTDFPYTKKKYDFPAGAAILTAGMITGIDKLRPETLVFKTGNTTGHTAGFVTASKETVAQKAQPLNGRVTKEFFVYGQGLKDVPFATLGDSGSFVLNVDRNLVGLLHMCKLIERKDHTFRSVYAHVSDIPVVFDDILGETGATRIQITGTQVFYP